MVRAGAARARADEARPPAASVPREVHPAARRGAPAPACRRGGQVLDPFAGSGRRSSQSLESGHEATGIDLAAFNCLLMRVKTARYNLVHARARPARRARPLRARRGRRRSLRPGTWPSGSRRRQPPTCSLPVADRRLRARRCAADRARARGALGAAGRRTSTSTFPARRRPSRTGATSTSASAARSSSAAHFLRRYTLDTIDAAEGVRAAARPTARPGAARRCARGRPRPARLRRASSPRRRTRA